MTAENTTRETELMLRLLQGSGLVIREEIDAARSVASQRGISIVDAIRSQGRVTETNLKLAAELQQRVMKTELTIDFAIRALRIALQQRISLDEAISSVKVLHERTSVVVTATNELTNLMLSAKFISFEDLGRLIKLSQDSSMMIGQLMLLDNLISADEFLAALNAVQMIRQHGLTKDRAAQALRHARQKGIGFVEAMDELGFTVRDDELALQDGDLFLKAGLIAKEDLAECLEIEVFKRKKLGQILLERGMATAYQLECSARLIAMVNDGLLTLAQAAKTLHRVSRENLKLEAALETSSS